MHVKYGCSTRNVRQWCSIVLNVTAVVILLCCVPGARADSDKGSAEPSLSHVTRIGDWSFNDVRSTTAHLRTSGRFGNTISFIAPRSNDRDKNYRFSISCNRFGEVLNIDVSDLELRPDFEGIVAQFKFIYRTFDLYTGDKKPKYPGTIDTFFEEHEIKSTDIKDLLDALGNADKFVLTIGGALKPVVYAYQLSETRNAVDRLNRSCTENQS